MKKGQQEEEDVLGLAKVRSSPSPSQPPCSRRRELRLPFVTRRARQTRSRQRRRRRGKSSSPNSTTNEPTIAADAVKPVVGADVAAEGEGAANVGRDVDLGEAQGEEGGVVPESTVTSRTSFRMPTPSRACLKKKALHRRPSYIGSIQKKNPPPTHPKKAGWGETPQGGSLFPRGQPNLLDASVFFNTMRHPLPTLLPAFVGAASLSPDFLTCHVARFIAGPMISHRLLSRHPKTPSCFFGFNVLSCSCLLLLLYSCISTA